MTARVDGEKRCRAVAVGLTGGIGAGKSTALAVFKELGALTISADRVVHDLYTRPSLLRRLVEHFGAEILDCDGRLDRRFLATLLRGRRDELRWVEGLIHPLVAQEIRSFIDQAPATSVVVCEVPLLFEVGYEAMFDLLVTVEASHEQRLARNADRFERDSFLEFERLQASTARRAAGSHFVFCNDGDIEVLHSFVRTVYERASGILRGAGE